MHKTLVGQLKDTRHCVDLGIDVRITLKCILQKHGVLNSSLTLLQRVMASCCEHRKQKLWLVNSKELLDSLNTTQIFKKSLRLEVNIYIKMIIRARYSDITLKYLSHRPYCETQTPQCISSHFKDYSLLSDILLTYSADVDAGSMFLCQHFLQCKRCTLWDICSIKQRYSITVYCE